MITLFSIIVLGFFLGMRHATDPDHVIAVTTIVSRQRSIRHAALIGVLWGLGHTITILAVGSAIILFGIVIPPRLGLTMELSVGLMLILLGILSLSGILRWITETVTPSQLRHHSHPHGHGDYVHSHPHGLYRLPNGFRQRSLHAQSHLGAPLIFIDGSARRQPVLRAEIPPEFDGLWQHHPVQT